MTLLEEGAVQIICDALTVGSVGNISRQVRPEPLPLGSYQLASVALPDEPDHRRSYLHDALQHVREPSLGRREGQRLRRELAARALTYPAEAANGAVAETVREVVQGHPWIGTTIRNVVRNETGHSLDAPVDFQAEDLGQNSVRIVTSLGQSLALDLATEHRIIERALLAAAGVNQRLHLMMLLNAMTGFQSDEARFFEDKLTFLMRQVDPTRQEDRFDRIVDVAGLPSLADLPPGTTVDVDRLLEIRNDPECRNLRAWVRGSEALTDDEIREQVNAVRERVAQATQSTAGKTVRFLATTAADLLPYGGVAFGAIDTFVVDKVLGRPGPAVFLAKHYPSLFDEPQ
jgi:hypothetical protein